MHFRASERTLEQRMCFLGFCKWFAGFTLDSNEYRDEPNSQADMKVVIETSQTQYVACDLEAYIDACAQ